MAVTAYPPSQSLRQISFPTLVRYDPRYLRRNLLYLYYLADGL